MNKLTKLVSALFALTLLLALPMGPAGAGPKGPQESALCDGDSDNIYPLIAGQTTQVGTVSVFNDGTNLYVVYNIDETLNPDDNYKIVAT